MLQQISSLEEYQRTYKNSIEHPENFWADVAENFLWKKKWDKVFCGGFEKADYKWYEGGKINITENCLDRHLESSGNKTAILWEPNNPTEQNRKISYNELHVQV